jgi:dipeptidyl aminopeptidase/acylaminoacyl peptidase
MRRIIVWLIAVPLLLVAVINVICAEMFLYPLRAHASGLPEAPPPLVIAVPVWQTTLRAYLYPGRSRATVVVSPGSNAPASAVGPWVAFLHRAGYTVVSYDPRGTAGRLGVAQTFGAREADDLVRLLRVLARRHDVDAHRVALLGLSLGGSVSLLAAARDRSVRAVVDDSGFADARAQLQRERQLLLGPLARLAILSNALMAVQAHVSMNAIRPIDAVASIAPRPLLIIHGLDDVVVPPADSQRLCAAAGPACRLWLVPHAGHIGALSVAPDQYPRRVLSFLHAALGDRRWALGDLHNGDAPLQGHRTCHPALLSVSGAPRRRSPYRLTPSA